MLLNAADLLQAGLLDEMGEASSCALLKCVIACDIDRVSDVMVILHDWNAPMNIRSYNIIIKAFCTRAMLAEALDIFGLLQVCS